MPVDRYFQCSPEQYKNHKSILLPDGDILPLDIFINSLNQYEDEEKIILLVRIDDGTIQELQDQIGCADPLSLEAVKLLGIQKVYIGPTEEHVYTKYPELRGQIQTGTDEAGNPIMTDILSKGRWA